MDTQRTIALATALVFLTGSLWGLYWLPVRAVAAQGLTGVWGTVAIVAAGALVMAPIAWRGRRAFAGADLWGIAATGLGGFAFVLYSVSFLYGQVAVVVILFFLTPVWSTLLGWWLMGWPITRMRVAVLITGLVGLLIMLGGEGVAPIPRSVGEWLGLASGFCWAVASIGIRVKSVPPAPQSAFVFALGALICGTFMALIMDGLPDLAGVTHPLRLAGLVAVTGGFWWAVFIVSLMWAAPRLDPARVGILLMAEVLVAAVSAAWLIGEHLSVAQLTGGGLVLLAGVLELLPVPRKAERPARSGDN